jgi:hypothetical protein
MGDPSQDEGDRPDIGSMARTGAGIRPEPSIISKRPGYHPRDRYARNL